MKFKKSKIPGLVICNPIKIKDSRGYFMESFKKESLEKFIGVSINFCQENISESKFGVLRGLHFQIPPHSQSKLISVQKGKILDVVVDLRKKSKFHGKHFSTILSKKNNKHLFIPKGFAHGFIVLSKTARICYKIDNYYNPKFDRGLNYNDPAFKINWKIDDKSIILSEKDKNYPAFSSNYFFN